MPQYVATIYYNATDHDTKAHEEVIGDALDGHGLEINDIHVEEVHEFTTTQTL